jgi:hypothetical protein
MFALRQSSAWSVSNTSARRFSVSAASWLGMPRATKIGGSPPSTALSRMGIDRPSSRSCTYYGKFAQDKNNARLRSRRFTCKFRLLFTWSDERVHPALERIITYARLWMRRRHIASLSQPSVRFQQVSCSTKAACVFPTLLCVVYARKAIPFKAVAVRQRLLLYCDSHVHSNNLLPLCLP